MKRRTLKVNDNVSFVPYFAITKTAKYSRYINFCRSRIFLKRRADGKTIVIGFIQ